MTHKSLFISLSVLILSCQPKSLSKSEIEKILHERNEKLAELFKEGDAAKLSMMYSDSAKLCPNHEGLFVGRKAIEEFWRKDLESGAKVIEMNTETITVDGTMDVLYETGKTTTRTLYKDSVYTFKVKFANIWKRQSDGNYLLDVDIWNSLPD